MSDPYTYPCPKCQQHVCMGPSGIGMLSHICGDPKLIRDFFETHAPSRCLYFGSDGSGPLPAGDAIAPRVKQYSMESLGELVCLEHEAWGGIFFDPDTARSIAEWLIEVADSCDPDLK